MTVYTDGRYAGTNSGINQPVSFTLRPGTNVLAVRCLNLHGEAGILGSLSNALVTDSRWKCTGRGKRYRIKGKTGPKPLSTFLTVDGLIGVTCQLSVIKHFGFGALTKGNMKKYTAGAEYPTFQ